MLIAFIGVLLLAAVLVDVFWTALVLAGAGPLSSATARILWSVARAVPLTHRTRSLFGPAILLGLVFVWTALLWVGWFCVFSASPGSVVHASSRIEATAWETFYFAGYTVFTLGNGDFAPNGMPWNVLTAAASGTGLVVITLAITYLIGVLSAVVEKRALAASFADLGGSPHAIVRNGWTGSDFAPLENCFPQIASAMSLYVQRHLAYPILHYFHGEDLRVSMPVRLAALHEALLILAEGVHPESRMHPLYTAPLLRSIRSFAEVASSEFVKGRAEAPEPPRLSDVAASGMPVVDAETFSRAVAHEDRTRQILRAVVEHDARRWENVWQVPQQ